MATEWHTPSVSRKEEYAMAPIVKGLGLMV